VRVIQPEKLSWRFRLDARWNAARAPQLQLWPGVAFLSKMKLDFPVPLDRDGSVLRR